MGHGDDGCDYGRGIGVGGDVLDEGDVDLQVINREPFQIIQRRIAGPEIVNGDAESQVFEISLLLSNWLLTYFQW